MLLISESSRIRQLQDRYQKAVTFVRNQSNVYRDEKQKQETWNDTYTIVK